MKKTSEDQQQADDLRAEYDLKTLKVVARGPGRRKPDDVAVVLEPDVAELFPDAAAVNQALRFLARITRQATRAHPKGV